MEGSKAHPTEFDAYDEAEPDEPVFVLRANDPLAAGVVREWAERFMTVKAAGVGVAGMELRDLRKHQQALKIADAMENWLLEQTFGACID